MVKPETETQTGAAKAGESRQCRTLVRRILRAVFIFIALGATLLFAAGLVLVNRPEILGLGETLSARLSEITGLECRAAGPVEVGIFPVPHIQVYRVSLFAPAAPESPVAPVTGNATKAAPAQNATAPQSADIPNALLLAGPSGNASAGAAVYEAAVHPESAGDGGVDSRLVLSVAAVRLDLKILSLLSGGAGLRRVDLFDPVLSLDALRAVLAEKESAAASPALSREPSLPANAVAVPGNATSTAPVNATASANATSHATTNATSPAGAESMADDVLVAQGDASGEPPLDPAGLLELLPDMTISGGVVFEGTAATGRRVLANGINLKFSGNDLRLSLRSHALADAGGSPSLLDVRLSDLSAAGGEIKAEARLAVTLNVLAQTLRPKISAELSYATADGRLTVTNFALALEKLRINSQFTARFPEGAFEVAGRLEHQGLSLPRWFQFGRNLPGSLQYALDDLSGEMTFDLNQDRLEVSHMVTHVLGMTLTGTGGTPDFAAPVVVIEGRGPLLDVNTIFPEVVDPPPLALSRVHYDEPPLVGGESVDDSDLPDVGHDIKIAGDKALVRRLTVDNLAVRIVPSDRGTQCLFSLGAVAGGKMDADLTVLSGTDKIEIDARPVNLSVQTLGQDLFGRAPLVTPVSGTIKATAIPDTLDVFFRSMDAQFALKFGAGSLFLRESNRKLVFDSVAASGRGVSKEGQDGNDSMLIFNGDWNFQAVSGKEKLNATLKGPLGVDEESLDLYTPGGDLSAEANVDMAFLGLKPEHNAKFSGRFAYDDRARTLALNKASFTLPYGTAAGDITCREQGFSGEAWTGAVSLKVPSTRDWLGYMGFERGILAEHGLEKGEFTFKFEQNAAKWALKDGDLFLDDKVRGRFNLAQAGDKGYTFSLNLDSINIDDYYPPRKASSPLPSPKPWDLTGVLKSKIKGEISIKDLAWRKLHYNNVSTKVSLENGRFSIPTSAAFYGGQNTADLTGTLEPNRINAKFSLDFKGANLGPMTKDLYTDERATGRINVSLQAGGSPDRASEILTAFSGNWAFDVGPGYFRGKRDQSTSKEPSKTEFSAIKSSGRLYSGRLETDNFTLSAPGSTDTLGRGYVDIARDTIDMDFEVRMLGIDVPVKLSGPLDDPATTVKSGKLIGNAVGGIGSGLFGLVVDVITLPGKVIMLPFGNGTSKSSGSGGAAGGGSLGGAGGGTERGKEGGTSR